MYAKCDFLTVWTLELSNLWMYYEVSLSNTHYFWFGWSLQKWRWFVRARTHNRIRLRISLNQTSHCIRRKMKENNIKYQMWYKVNVMDAGPSHFETVLHMFASKSILGLGSHSHWGTILFIHISTLAPLTVSFVVVDRNGISMLYAQFKVLALTNEDSVWVSVRVRICVCDKNEVERYILW